MGRLAQSRRWHVLILVCAYLLCTLPNLGEHALWDVDEGVNAEAAREMREAGTWIVPTFNYELRTAKPAMLYWWQMGSYTLFGISEWSARLPSVVAGLGSVLLTYLLGSRMFGALTGFWSASCLCFAIAFCVLSHTASPDAILLFFTMVAFTTFWRHAGRGGHSWCVPMAAACACAVLTKGPVGVALPGAVVCVYFAWSGEFKRLLTSRMLKAAVVFGFIALPWYILVGVETRGQFLKVFLGRENVSRFLTPMENHSGNFLFHPLALFIGFAPGSVVLILSVWEAIRLSRASNSVPETRQEPVGVHEYRFLLSWISVYLFVFSVAATKLPNYVLPVYPAVAILAGRLLERWRSGLLQKHAWGVPTAVAGLAMVGIITVAGLAIASGAVDVGITKMRVFPGLERFIWIGAIPLAGALFCAWCLRRKQTNLGLSSALAASLLFTASIAAFPVETMDGFKAPKALVEQGQLAQPDRDIRIASLFWFQPSTVFYVKREIRKLSGLEDVKVFLNAPRESYLLIDEPTWVSIAAHVGTQTMEVTRHYDFYSNKQILLIRNSYGEERAAAQ
jgi:4-amino-4-deoxy-L-arabinose transferase-like glycosyltransferase